MSYNTLKIFLKVVHVISKVYNKMALLVNFFGVKGVFSIRVMVHNYTHNSESLKALFTKHTAYEQ